MSEDSHAHHDSIVVIIDKKEHKAPKADMTGAELKALGSVPANMRLFKVVPGPDPDEPIGDAEVVHLKNGDHFCSLPPGTVGDLLPTVEAELAEVKAIFPDAIVHLGDGASFFIELPTVGLPAGKGWDQKTTQILLPVPAGYPASRPPNFFVSPTLTRGGGNAGGKGGASTVAGGQWSPMCWNPAHSEEMRRSLVLCLRFAISRFQEAQ